MRTVLDRGGCSADPDLDFTISIYSNMLLGKGVGDGNIAHPEQLERARLDFTLNSLHVVDRYLGIVRARYDSLNGTSYFNTVIAVACYLGEVIRRGTPIGECQWVRATVIAPDKFSGGASQGAIADIVLASKNTDQLLRLAHMVAPYVSSDGHPSNTYEYAVVAMKSVWVSSTALSV